MKGVPVAQGRKDSPCPRQGLWPPRLVTWERVPGWYAPAQAEVGRRWGLRVTLGFTWGFRHISAGNRGGDGEKGVKPRVDRERGVGVREG